MLFEKDEDIELQPKRTKTLLISISIHVLLLAFVALNPDLLTGPPKRIIRIMGQDYDLSKEQLTELVEPPNEEPLKLELASFVNCVEKRGKPAVSGEDGLRALELAISINAAIAERLMLR